jgi:hypothetical protein
LLKVRRELAADRHRHLFNRGGGDDLDLDALGAGDGEWRNAADIDIERAGGERLDHHRAGLEIGEARREPGGFEHAELVGDENLRRAENRDEADPKRNRLRYRRLRAYGCK